MMGKPIIFTLAALALVSMACRLSINLPVDQIVTGPTQTEEIFIPEPDAKTAELEMTFGAGQLIIKPGAEGAFVSGSATYNVEDFQPTITIDGSKVKLKTGDLEISGIPNFGDDIENKWDLELSDMPMALVLNAGAYKGDIDLGGLSVIELEVADGAADVTLGFSEPNKVEMNSLRYTTGASTVRLNDLANANFTSMIFRGGAGDYTLDFSGELQRDAVVTVEAGISQVLIIVPDDMNVRVFFKGGLADVSLSGNWRQLGGSYIVEGDGPTLTINVDLGAGNLELETN